MTPFPSGFHGGFYLAFLALIGAGLVFGPVPAAQASCSGVEACLNDLRSSDDSVRANAVFQLGNIKTRKATPALVKLLKTDPDDSIRRSSIQALGAIGDPAAVRALKPLMRDGVFRRDVVKALVAIKDETAVAALIDGLKHEETQLSAAQGLGEIASPSAKPALIRLMRKTKNERVFGVASMAVQRINALWGPTAEEMGVPLYPESDFIPNANGEWVFLSGDPVRKVAEFYQKKLGSPALDFQSFVSRYEREFRESREGGPGNKPAVVIVAREQRFQGKKYPSTIIFLDKVLKKTEITVFSAKGGGD